MQTHRLPHLNMLALADRIQPLATELALARRHQSTVATRLTTSFDVSRVRAIGSQPRGTAIQTHSDLDLMVVLRKSAAKWRGDLVSSETVLRQVLVDLRSRHPNTDIRRDAQAAVVSFGGGKRSLDVVPALFLGIQDGRAVYRIPDGEGGWMQTSPDTHDRYFASADTQSSSKLRKVSQLLRWWKHSRAATSPLRSFYADLVLAGSGVCVGVKSYTQCLHDVFCFLNDRECQGLKDPCGIAGIVNACRTITQLTQVQIAVAFARQHAGNAISAEKERDAEEANRQWNLVFNGAY